MATLSLQTAVIAGTTITFSAAAGGGDQFANTGNERFVIKNGDASSHTVTFDSPTTCNLGAAANAAHDLTVTVLAGEEKWIGPFAMERFNDSNGNVQVSYSAVTSMTVAVVRK